MIEINVKSERREMTPDERWAHGLARGNAKSLLDETQKPNASHHDGAAPAPSVDGVVQCQNDLTKNE